jgi:hypothetical protein
MRRVIGIDIHRTFGEVVIWEEGVVRHFGRVDMTRTALEGFGKSLRTTDEVVIEGNRRPTRSMPARSPACTRPGICRRSGRLTPRPNASAGWWRGATKSCGIALESRTRFIQSCMRT